MDFRVWKKLFQSIVTEFTGFHWVLLGFCRVLPSFTGFSLVFH